MKKQELPTIKELGYLPGYYKCPKCNNHYLSDFPFARANCLECGSRIRITEISRAEINGLLYNLHILASALPHKQWSREQIAEFCQYEDVNRVILLMRFLLGNGYIRFKEEKDMISELVVHTTKIVQNQTRGA